VHVTTTVTVDHHPARQAAHRAWRGLHHHPQTRPRAVEVDEVEEVDDVEPVEPDEQVTALAVGGIRARARECARRRLGYRRGLQSVS
jgi:hypothetical protein